MKTENYLFIKEIASYIVGRFEFVDREVAEYIACQAALESLYGKSIIALENKNFFGMKKPRLRLTTCIGENRGHAVYPSWMSGVYDYFYWCQYKGFSQKSFSSLDGFKRKIKVSNYCPRWDYFELIEQIYKLFKNYQK